MDDLILQVSGQAGIDANQARKAIEAVASYLKQNLPAQYRGLVGTLMSNPKAAGEMLRMFGDVPNKQQ